MRINKKAAAVAVAAVALAGTGVAYAYWTTSGSGTGSAATSAGAASLLVSETTPVSNMFPGDAAQGLSGTVKNTAANSAYVAKVVASISGVTQAVGAVGTCDATDYTLATPTMLIGQDLTAGQTVAFSGASIKFNNKPSNQDGCKGATVNLLYTAS
jgi:hypothetical protein